MSYADFDVSVLNNKSFLFVEDDQFVVAMTKFQFDALKEIREFIHVADYESALKLLQEKHFDVILLDNMFPPSSGAFAEKHQGEALAKYILTAYETCNIARPLIIPNSSDPFPAYLCDANMSKPFVMKRLVDEVSKWNLLTLEEKNTLKLSQLREQAQKQAQQDTTL